MKRVSWKHSLINLAQGSFWFKVKVLWRVQSKDSWGEVGELLVCKEKSWKGGSAFFCFGEQRQVTRVLTQWFVVDFFFPWLRNHRLFKVKNIHGEKINEFMQLNGDFKTRFNLRTVLQVFKKMH